MRDLVLRLVRADHDGLLGMDDQIDVRRAAITTTVADGELDTCSYRVGELGRLMERRRQLRWLQRCRQRRLLRAMTREVQTILDERKVRLIDTTPMVPAPGEIAKFRAVAERAAPVD
jgi:methyl coenzyme M reductase subunit C-like uncharacterized protein (methanogenesis marker protein 7)